MVMKLEGTHSTKFKLLLKACTTNSYLQSTRTTCSSTSIRSIVAVSPMIIMTMKRLCDLSPTTSQLWSDLATIMMAIVTNTKTMARTIMATRINSAHCLTNSTVATVVKITTLSSRTTSITTSNTTPKVMNTRIKQNTNKMRLRNNYQSMLFEKSSKRRANIFHHCASATSPETAPMVRRTRKIYLPSGRLHQNEAISLPLTNLSKNRLKSTRSHGWRASTKMRIIQNRRLSA